MSVPAPFAPRAAAVRLDKVAKRYGNAVAVKPLDLTFPAGSLVTLLGPSGCGKTTLLRMIAGLERVSEGRILIGDSDVTALSAGERNVSMVFQSYALFPHMSVRENVAYGLVSSGIGKAEAHRQAEEALATVGLSGYGDRLPSEMSGGQQQRVAVARALVLKPDVLLFDEPLSNLDARLRRAMREDIRALQQRLGVTVVYVTHDQAEALAVSDLIVVMNVGEVAQIGTPQELYEQPNSVFVATFMGEANAVKGSSDGASVTLARVTVPVRPGGPQGESVDVVIRPEAIGLVAAGTPGSLPGTVVTATYMGSAAEYRIDTALGRLLAISPGGRTMAKAGETVGLTFAPAGVMAVAP